jgi:hypothetical protein
MTDGAGNDQGVLEPRLRVDQVITGLSVEGKAGALEN